MFNKVNKYVCFGEVLMDNFPTGKVIGGAPLNVAVWLSKFGQLVSMFTGVGDDDDGKRLMNHMQEYGIDTEFVQVNKELKTGLVEVKVDYRGSATYSIPHPVAWDKVEFVDAMAEKVQAADAFFYSTLPARDDVNYNTITRLLPHAKYKIMDANLRPPHYDETVVTTFCKEADLIKFNDDELFEIARMYGSTYKSLEENMQFMQGKTNTPTICVTKGKHGGMVLHDGEITYFSGYIADVIDTVGAGDSFLAAFSAKFLTGSTVLDSLKFACAVGAFVASHRGGNPKIRDGELDAYMEKL